jgi:hypothetical protein
MKTIGAFKSVQCKWLCAQWFLWVGKSHGYTNTVGFMKLALLTCCEKCLRALSFVRLAAQRHLTTAQSVACPPIDKQD